jgi:hypothetical protein
MTPTIVDTMANDFMTPPISVFEKPRSTRHRFTTSVET